MKYSLRSLMTFSIRDLMWLTVVVALIVLLVLQHRAYTESALGYRRLLNEQVEETNYYKGIRP